MNEKKHSDMSANERSPLIQRVPVDEHRERYPHTTVRRLCTIILTTIPLLTFAVVFLCILIAGQNDLFSDHDTAPSTFYSTSFLTAHDIPHQAWPESEGVSFAKLKKILGHTPSNASAKEWSRYYTSGPHLTGKNKTQAEWTRDKWSSWGIKSSLASYDVYLNYPVDHRLALLNDGKVSFEATLEEDVLEEDPTTGLEDRVPVFHGYSASGNVTAPYVYVNYGTYQDFEDLKAANISVEGKIVLAKYGGIFRGLKAKRASEQGAIGCILYTDTGDDGEMTEENGYTAYPDGPARQPSSVQRGSMQFLSFAPGDPTTPGYPSLPDAPREPVDGKIPDIPSIPISYVEALPLLKALNGHGPSASSFGSHWQTGGLGYKGVEYSIGPSPDSVTINLVNEQEYVTTPLWNVIGVINGSLADEVIVIGCHRDAWIAGGAGDPNSGSAALNEIVRSFGAALDAGWKPLRTVVFASWDGEEYGLLGSTEWVEEYLPWLSDSTVAYINLDVGASGPEFSSSAAPVLNKVLYDVTREVKSPNQTHKGQTVFDVWDGKIGTMGSGSDFTAFQDFAGISSIHIEFSAGAHAGRNGKLNPIYHYHSNYDSFHWMEKFGDPTFEYHSTIAKIGALLAAQLVEQPLIPFNATDYAVGLAKYLKSVEKLAEEKSYTTASGTRFEKDIFSSLEDAIAAFKDVATTFDAEAAALAAQLAQPVESRTPGATVRLYEDVHKVNVKYKYLERQFLYEDGLDGRNWFKHVVFAPGLWTGYAGATFPGLVEAIEFGTSRLEKWVDIIEQRVDGAIGLLE
ncbi:putative glutamate carboxypeptidase [Teratosphaeria destructans]|uniref:Glutamate carboxypeptidase n=1 Tax=Teratosphaeria destructans TaxID=418781 RepID=A0A9W7SX95_9PEZI|nr:putative glutamate carboxypeptidase [Teratosphaeria destructans]